MLSEDNWIEISHKIPIGCWKNFIFTCKLFYKFNDADIVKKEQILLLNYSDFTKTMV